jgi:translation initiation factor eIF-2B subunit beta
LEFLYAAKEKKRSFRVFVAEGAPRFVQGKRNMFSWYNFDSLSNDFFFLAIRYQGHLLAKELVTRGLQTTLITDSAVFAMISRVNMVY